ncbi:hypothetical protein [Epilithonimonas sp.]|uniref:hypothetical protein n=1 Tax=Epilithonimonas sp. TaxID=2894511 RepID=UPI00289AE4CD|nr:hypothetical protein [Epilithonimonas sp.]
MDRIDLFNEIYEKTNLNPHRLEYLKKDLIERREFLKAQLESVRKWHRERNTDPNRNPEIGILTNSIIESEIKLGMIDDELRRLNPNKLQANNIMKRKALAFNNQVNDSLGSFQIIITEINQLLFDNSDIIQWEQLLKGENLDNSIIIKNGIAIKDFKYFISTIQEDYKILKGRIYGDLEGNKAFLWNGNLLKAEQIRKVENTTLPKLKPQIDEILSLL